MVGLEEVSLERQWIRELGLELGAPLEFGLAMGLLDSRIKNIITVK